MSPHHPSRNRATIFLSSVFFVLGFSVVFSIVGVLLQTVLANSSVTTQEWLGRIGGAIIILFGLVMVGLLKVSFLQAEHKFHVKRKFKSMYLTSFVFGAAFALGWTPCVSAALGAILALAVSSPGQAFVLMFAYTLGLGIPFLIVGLFTEQAARVIRKAGPWLSYLQIAFGVILIVMGILIFVGQLSRIANVGFLVDFLVRINPGTAAGAGIATLSLTNIALAFIAGLGSFLSPCILPLIPGFLSYLASTAVGTDANSKDPQS